MKKSITMVLATSLLTLGAMSSASASGEQESLELCRAALAESGGEAEFKSMRGASTRKLSFEVETEDGVETIICTVKRGEVVALNGDGLIAARLAAGQ